MENATKAMLIAAAVLITIVLIAMGVLLLGNTSEVSDQAEEAGGLISTATKDARRAMYNGKNYSRDNLYKQDSSGAFYNMGFKEDGRLPADWGGSGGVSDNATILNTQSNYTENVLVIGYLLQGWQEGATWKSLEGVEIDTSRENDYEYMINEWIPKQLKQKNLKKVYDLTDTKKLLSDLIEKIKEKHGDEITVSKNNTNLNIMYLNEKGKSDFVFGNPPDVKTDKKIAKLVYIIMLERM